MNWQSTAVTDQGRARANNEDAFAVREERGVFVLADGMGGHAAGEVASALAAGVVCERVAAALEERADADAAALDTVLREAVLAAHRAVLERSRREPDKLGMGTTLTALVLHGESRSFRIAHVGDSRAYLLRDDELRQLTTDHTWVQEQVERGLLSPEQARGHPHANVVTRAVGTHDEAPAVDVEAGDARPGDAFLLCSDGLSNVLDPGELLDALAEEAPLEAVGSRMVEIANARGGPDNITAILVRVTA